MTRVTRSRRAAGRLLSAAALALCANCLAPTRALAQQGDSTHARIDSTARRGLVPLPDSDSVAVAQRPHHKPPSHERIVVKPPIPPGRAFLYSFLLPGLGEAKLDRPGAGAFFFGIEIVSIAQARQAIIDRNYNAHHTSDSVITSYQTDGTTGAPLLDSLGRPLPAGFVINRYASSTDRLGARRLHVEDWIAAIIFNHLISGADALVTAELWDLPRHVSAFRAADGRTVIAATISVR